MKATYNLFRFFVAVILAAAVAPAFAAGGGHPLDRFPTAKLNDVPSLQRGAQLFANYCMGCHSLGSMRFNRMRDIGLNEDQIKDNLIFTNAKVGELMKIPMRANDAKKWFGALPPDLSVTARSRSSGGGSGSDWIYTFLRTFYRDASRPTGWNNAAFPNVGMPHVLWDLQGPRDATITDTQPDPDAAADSGGHGAGPMIQTVTSFDDFGLTQSVTNKVSADDHAHAGTSVSFGQASGGQLTKLGFDDSVGDLVAYLTYVSDPSAKTRGRIGIWVLMFLALFFVAAWMLNNAFWKEVK